MGFVSMWLRRKQHPAEDFHRQACDVLDIVRNLGVLFDGTLSGKEQVTRFVKQVFLKLRQLHYFSYILSPSIKINLVKSLVLPIFA
jgi:hypothetical protein